MVEAEPLGWEQQCARTCTPDLHMEWGHWGAECHPVSGDGMWHNKSAAHRDVARRTLLQCWALSDPFSALEPPVQCGAVLSHLCSIQTIRVRK